MIVRAARPHHNFTVVHNQLIEDDRLTWKARGLLVYLLSKPDHWRTTAAYLASQSPEGLHSVRTGLTELERVGYIKRLRKQNPSGQWSTHTVVFDHPQPVDKDVDKVGYLSTEPKCGKPNFGKPDSLVSTDLASTQTDN